MVNRLRVQSGSKQAVQKFNENFELLTPLHPTARKILAVLGSGGVAAEAQRVVGCAKSLVTYWKNKFLKAGALTIRCDGIVKYYDLTPYGSTLLRGSDGVVRFPVLFEDRPVKFRVLRREQVPLDWRPLGNPNNWRKMGVRIGEVRVVLHEGLGPNRDECNVIIHPGQVKGFSSSEVFEASVRVVERVRNVLEVKFGMVLDEVGEVVGSPRYRVYRPECRAWIEAGCVEVEGVGALDKSGTHDKQDPLSGVPHLEYADGVLADLAASVPMAGRGPGVGEAAVEFPLVLRQLLQENLMLKRQLNDLKVQFEALAASNRGVVEAVQGLVSMFKGEVWRLNSGGVDYAR